jgi:hypothetical protein
LFGAGLDKSPGTCYGKGMEQDATGLKGGGRSPSGSEVATRIAVGETNGRRRQDRDHQRHGSCPKRIFLFALANDARRRLAAG